MMKCALLVVLLAVVSAAAVNKHELHAHEIRHYAKAANELLVMKPLRSFDLEASTCTEAIAEFNATVHTAECGAVYVAFDTHAGAVALSAAVNYHCDGEYENGLSCDAVLHAQLEVIRTYCLDPAVYDNLDAITKLALASGIREIAYAVNLPCLRDDTSDALCVPQFATFADALSTIQPGQLTSTLLDSGCNDCTRKVIEIWAAFQPVEAVTVALRLNDVCMKRDGDYCALHFQEMQLAEANAGSGSAGSNSNPFDPTALAMFCHPCTVAYTSRALALYVIDASLGGMDPAVVQGLVQAYAMYRLYAGFMCVRDLSGSYCIYEFASLGQNAGGMAQCDLGGGSSSIPTTPGSGVPGSNSLPGLPDTCPAQCTVALTAVKRDLGCCFGTMFDFLGAIGGLLGSTTNQTGAEISNFLDEMITFIEDTCHVPVGASCTDLRYSLAATVIFNNFDLDAYNAAPLPVRLAILNSIAYAIGVDNDQVINLQLTTTATTGSRRLLGNSGSISASFSISSNSPALFTHVNEALADAVFTGVNGLDATYMADPSSPVTTVSTSELTTSGASFAAPVIALALLPILAYLA